ncbi:MAG: D-glycerate dehydrogenase, partial [Ignavibacteriaceae bacterium]
MKIFITRDIPAGAIEFLKSKKFKVSVYRQNVPVTRKDFIRLAKDADGIIPMLSEKIDASVIDELKKCKVIANYAVGYNNID